MEQQTHGEESGAAESLTGSEEALIILPGTRRASSNMRALKITGLTVLACLLVASQVFTAYLLYDQKGQIHDLKKDSESLRKELTRKAQGPPVQLRLPMYSLPLLTDFTEDGAKNAETPLTKLEDVAIVSVEKQLKDLLQNSQLPQFNGTFLANLESLKTQMEEWKVFESWMRNWLIFQMAQETPTTQSASRHMMDAPNVTQLSSQADE